ncbi:TetR/AcrR family transcriptional regulator [Shewanella woodyi]|uniref:Putative transcriptional regulator, TetR family n=1 Tax=Shewanella woodyi (strain ATCC 51908 / MS32) TaxID=392500 RepID=B1KFW8_SHEWM|nr:TetR/AcrR family transcriptional regulator [Shewanella woodyi]ACA86675.1 putative transcriptional regulator, TetR family [Shewanella woodyi ATCC 51908]
MTIKDKVDGRLKRSEANRQLIIDAMINLVNRGNYMPTAQQVADTSGVSIRTVFRHFTEMELLYREIDDVVKPLYISYFKQDFKGDLQTRIKRLANAVVNGFSGGYHLSKVTTVLKWRSPVLQATYDYNQKMLRLYVLSMLPELKKCDSVTTELVVGMASFAFFERLHMDQGLSLAVCKKLIIAHLSSVFEAELK